MQRVRMLVMVLGFATLAVGAASPALDAPPRIVITTTVAPVGAGPGSSVTQTVQVANDGDGVAVLLVVTADLAPGCRWMFTVLLPRQARTETCTGVVAAGATRLTVSVSGRTRAGDPVRSSTSVQFRSPDQPMTPPMTPPSTRPSRPVPGPAPGTAAAPATAAIPAPAAAAPAPQAPPSSTPAAPLRQAVAQRPGVTPARGTAAPAATPSADPSATPTLHPTRAAAAAPRRVGQWARQEGPLSDPPRTAAIVAVLGVFVMTVSVGALSAAIRVR